MCVYKVAHVALYYTYDGHVSGLVGQGRKLSENTRKEGRKLWSTKTLVGLKPSANF